MLTSIHHCGRGLLVLVGTLLGLTLLAAVNFEHRPKIYVAGEVAERDVVADRDLRVEDVQATQLRREQLILLQPAVYDLSYEPYSQLHTRIVDLFRELNEIDPDKKYTAVAQLMDTLTPDVAEDVILQLTRPEVQAFVLQRLLPLVRGALNEGLVSDVRAARVGKSGVIIRHVDTGAETLRPDLAVLPDVQSSLISLTSKLRQEKDLTPPAQKSLAILLSALISPSLHLNRDATRHRSEAVADNVEPVYYHLQRGEMVVRKGERVNREQQLKLQAIYSAAGERIHWQTALGSFGLSLLLGMGLFMAPSGKPGTPLRCKDYLLMALVLAFFSMGAKVVYLLGLRTGDFETLSVLSYSFPVAGAVGLVAMVFAARRYCTMGLLLSFFATLMFKGDISLFLYFFLGGMLTTWLVTRAQSRQDVVWSIIPLTVGQVVIWFAASMMAQTPMSYMPLQLAGAVANSVISLLTLFALSPVLELSFGYTTRFRLMELMSLEQPLMQEVMMTMPGTYHHSLVVANMVEAGAKAIGANSLLCKVAALYHDAGKLSHPEYFIENQYGGRNKHDKLAPSMSALILTAHVKKGTELADAHKLGQEIIDIIRQHHGTRVIRFFYQKAADLGENPRESDYCYPGPRPQTKEAAILMLADSVEASSRTLTDPTPARIKGHIDNIIKGIFSEGQLDESELTFKDLHKLSENFLRILTGIFHQRIAYPDVKGKAAAPSALAPGLTPASGPAPVAVPAMPAPALPAPPTPDSVAEEVTSPRGTGPVAVGGNGNTANSGQKGNKGNGENRESVAASTPKEAGSGLSNSGTPNSGMPVASSSPVPPVGAPGNLDAPLVLPGMRQ